MSVQTILLKNIFKCIKKCRWVIGVMAVGYLCVHLHNVGIEKSLQNRIMDRPGLLKEQCPMIQNNYNARFTFYPEISEVIGNQEYKMCKVPKGGCTFWLQVFLLLENVIESSEVWNLDREDLHWKLQNRVIQWEYMSMPTDVMIMVTRNPWQRIYSAYMDKIYRAQANFIELIKEMAPQKTDCVNIPTFQEFLDYIIKTAEENRMHDAHWQPISNLCRVCSQNYSYIIKHEYFVQETIFVLEQIMPGNYKTKETLKSLLVQNFQENSISQLVRQFVSETVTSKCYSILDSLKRLWVSLQSQGLISEFNDFDEDLFTNISTTYSDFIMDLFIAKSKGLTFSDDGRKAQRHRFLTRAYKTVRLETLYKIRDIYQNDFLLFGYDDTLPIYRIISPRFVTNEI